MALIVIVFVCHIIHVKLVFYIHVCNSYLTLSEHCLSEAVNTILVTDILKKIFQYWEISTAYSQMKYVLYELIEISLLCLKDARV
jgi:hypothetical protein